MRSFTLISVLIASLAATPISPPPGQNSNSLGSFGSASDNSQVTADINRKRGNNPTNNDSANIFGNQAPESQTPPTSGKNNIDAQNTTNGFGNQSPKPQPPPTSGISGIDTQDSTNIFGSKAPPTSGKSDANSNQELLIKLQKEITRLYLQYVEVVTKSYGTSIENMPKSSSDDSINIFQPFGSSVSEDGLDGMLNGEGGEVKEDKELPQNDPINRENFDPTNSSNQDKNENTSSDIPSTDNRPSPASDSKNEGLNKLNTTNNPIKANDKPQSTEKALPNNPSSNPNQTPSEKVEIQSNRVSKVVLAEGPHGLSYKLYIN
ncbi:hypothetical protein CONCODRAFT_4678 [Conidiobolus coronatus NRRL 28638]|uniref:Uncharacterized protein n=1 Tax=Conidiobolus coronatus (strain ATCC 28846 / CBS 209.66 / NRRL 28638) TaxID=796925 RepID=A0A137PBV7_CONC2|nr:hypothetical protein CONCODRAFT_4678 [Conidiobolus coronatus NRRL 28638]|eukprot:KXN72456.1 hypothetical protein CONCODRAFT_4678 [Conidiobolus coronatus NRRL 28638]